MEDIIFSDIHTRFTPRRIRGLKLWLDASRISGLADGDPITTWSDLSGNGNDATQATAAKKPLYKVNIQNGRPVVRGDGTDDIFRADGLASVFTGEDAPYTIAVVCKKTSGVGNDVFLGASDLAPPPQLLNGTDGDLLQIYRSPDVGGASNVSGGSAGSAFFIGVYVFSGTETTIYKNGATSVGPTSQDVGPLTITAVAIFGNPTSAAGTDFFDGDLAEVILYNRVLFTAERQVAERYLGSKYSISVG